MKKIKWILGILALSILPSCADYLDKEDATEATIEEVFQQRVLQERWLAHCYSGIERDGICTTRDNGWNSMADDLSPSERWKPWSWGSPINFYCGSWTPVSNLSDNLWANLQGLVRESLIFIERATPVPDEDLSRDEVNLMKVECRFLIAYYYWRLIKTYGPVPFTPDSYASTDASVSELLTGQTPFDDIVDWLDKELLEISKILPASYSNAKKYGRATSIMALAVRARMLLFAASPLVNGNPDYANHVDREGRHLFSTTYDPNKWKKAADATALLIQEAENAGHKLYYKYNEDGSIDPFGSYQDGFFVSNASDNPEILFPRVEQYSWDHYYFCQHASPKSNNCAGGLGVTQEYVDAFFTDNGLPITDPNSGYVESGFSTEDEVRYSSWNAGKPSGSKNQKIITAQGTYNAYTHREPRFYVSVVFHNAWNHKTQKHIDFLRYGKDNDANGGHDAPQRGYLVNKGVDPNFSTNSYPWYPGILYRLGEAYLNYAEILNEMDGGDRAKMLFYLNKVRERAGVRQYTTGATDSKFIHVDANDKEAMRKLIKAERRVELGCELGLRLDDLRRWKDAERDLNKAFTGMNFRGATEEEFFVRQVCESPHVFTKAMYWVPVSQTEIEKNSNLVQAPFWDATVSND